jgi:four helix bundle protein
VGEHRGRTPWENTVGELRGRPSWENFVEKYVGARRGRGLFSYGSAPLFHLAWRMSFEDLRVYQAAQELRREIDKLRKMVTPAGMPLFKHVDEAADSILNNLAEGSSSTYPGKRRHFYDIAAGSAREVRSGLRTLDRRNALRGTKIFRPIVLSLAIDKMIMNLIAALPA